MDGEIQITELVTVTPKDELTYDGYKIPNVCASWRPEGPGPELAGWVLVLDDSFVITVPRESELGRWVPFLANAMAVAAGFTSHGPNSAPRNPHGPSSAPDLEERLCQRGKVHELMDATRALFNAFAAERFGARVEGAVEEGPVTRRVREALETLEKERA